MRFFSHFIDCTVYKDGRSNWDVNHWFANTHFEALRLVPQSVAYMRYIFNISVTNFGVSFFFFWIYVGFFQNWKLCSSFFIQSMIQSMSVLSFRSVILEAEPSKARRRICYWKSLGKRQRESKVEPAER